MKPENVEILIVEDSAEDAEMAIMSIVDNKISSKILHVEDGVDALEFVFAEGKFADRNPQNFPKLILLDLKMPKINGSIVAEKIKSNDKTKHIPVVIMSSSKQEQDIAECYKAGVNSYVLKPIDFDTYAKTVVRVARYWLSLNHQQPNS